MKKTLALALFLAALLSPGPSGADERTTLTRENALLEAELELAKKPKVYFLLDLREKKVLYRAWGKTIKELSFERFALWNGGAEIKTRTVLTRSAFFKPKREAIRPKGEKEERDDLLKTDTFELDALELVDMPSNYTLILDGDVHVAVRPRPEGFFPAIGDAWHRFVWRLTRPPLTLWNALLGRRPVYIDLALDKTEAKALYWAAYEGAECIVYLP